jgi:hypothetical protein
MRPAILFDTGITKVSALRTTNHFRMENIMIPEEPMNTLEGIYPKNEPNFFETPALMPLDSGQYLETGPDAPLPFFVFGDADDEDDDDLEEEDSFDDIEDDFDDDFEDDDFDDDDDDFEDEDDDFDYEEDVDYDDFDE